MLKTRIYTFVLLILIISDQAKAQQDTIYTSQDAIYNRPFITIGKTQTAIGGYLEANTNYFAEDGVSEGFSMEMRRFNIFLYSAIIPRVSFLAELEFEHGTKEIELETALLDFEINTALNFRAGIILPQIGLVNANHDSPKWEFIERPLSSTQIIPTTLSEIGFGFHGKFFPGKFIISYDAYLVNGLNENIILNESGRTFLQDGKSEEMFEEDNNGTPMFNGKIAIARREIGELGVSYYGGTYNKFRIEGEQVEEKRNLSVFALDISTTIYKANIRGELVVVALNVPDDIREIYGGKQRGGFVETVYPLIERKILGYENAKINVNLRLERIDYNIGEFESTSSKIYDEVTAIAAGLSFRPSANTVIRANYRYHWIRDLTGNPAVHLAGFQFGMASYF
ncbi:MAG: hypothetical protein FVQ77_15715 [Cytophagales bacterium]|nr:hypothetical protein [Cytophagales bacterium]